MLFGKSHLSPDEIKERNEQIEEAIANNQYNQAFSLVKKLNSDDKNAGNYYMGICYHCGWGVKEDPGEALKYYNKAIYQCDNEATAWYMGGMIYMNAEDHNNALDWFVRAEECGERDAAIFVAVELAELSTKMRGMACSTLKMNEYSKLNASAAKLALQAQAKFIQVIENKTDDMDPVHWVLLGRMCMMLYNLACRGELAVQTTDVNNAKSYLVNSFNMMGGRHDHKSHEEWWNNVVSVCQIMEQYGQSLVAEYFRALCSMLDSELHHSAEAFYRAKWHLKRVGELRTVGDIDVNKEICGYLSDADDMHGKLNRKYGATVISNMRAGQLPDISASYLPGMAPEPESCDNFMQMFRAEQTVAKSTTVEQDTSRDKGRKGLFGLFKK